MRKKKIMCPLFPDGTWVKLMLRSSNGRWKCDYVAKDEYSRHDGKSALVVGAACAGAGNGYSYTLLIYPDNAEIIGMPEACLTADNLVLIR